MKRVMQDRSTTVCGTMSTICVSTAEAGDAGPIYDGLLDDVDDLCIDCRRG